METLPLDVLSLVCCSLTGAEVFRLSQVSAALRVATSSTRVWRRLFTSDECAGQQELGEAENYKKTYARARSIKFRGLLRSSDDRMYHDHGAFVVVRPPVRCEGNWKASPTAFTQQFSHDGGCSSVTIDAWFSLLPADDETHVGGVIFGVQSAPVASSIWPYCHHQPMVVDANRRLFCSLLDPVNTSVHSEPVGPVLVDNRWYHVALTFSGSSRVEKVFVNGSLVAKRVGDRHQDWRRLAHAQIGTGCITADGKSFPESDHFGWYGFNGVVDAFRIWEGAFDDDQIASLARGGSQGSEHSLWYSLQRDNNFEGKRCGTSSVRCTRPMERMFKVW